MPNTFIDNRDSWLRLSDIDYVGQFVKVWLAFNAWYRSAYTESRDREIINEFKWQSNPILNALRPKLESSGDDAVQFRAEIGLLHQRLESYELCAGKGTGKFRISLRSVFIRENGPMTETVDRYGFVFSTELLPSKQVTATVTRKRGGAVRLSMPAHAHNLEALNTLPAFAGLSTSQKNILVELYNRVSPRLFLDLTSFQEEHSPEMPCGAYQFQCGKENLFAGVVEVLYLMRCTLFHGELAPTKDSVVCYEPAFRLVRRFLDCVG